jgi:hypothetical protein
MKIKGMVAGALVAGGVVFAMTGGCLRTTSSAPDQRLAKRMGDICEIARDNVKTPEKGVRKLGTYLDKNVDKILADYGAMFAAIERIPDDKKHDDRARVARDRLRKADCQRDMQRFADAVSADPAASALVQRFGERLSRTLEIISGQNMQIDFSRLPPLSQLFMRTEVDPFETTR